MKNNKGFTLIELMAVIILLAVIGLIVFPTAIESINSSKEKLYKEQVKRILDTTDSWASSNDNSLPTGSSAVYITVDTLQKAGLLKKEDVKNPLDSSEKMDAKIVIYFDSEYNQYVAGYCDEAYSEYYYTDSEFNSIKAKCDIAEKISD